jgi:hypothetical protein
MAMRVVRWVALLLAIACAFLLGQKMCQEKRLDSMDDSILRLANAQYVLMDMSVRINHHVNPKHSRGTPFCPECFELLQEIGSHSEDVTNANAESVIHPKKGEK